MEGYADEQVERSCTLVRNSRKTVLQGTCVTGRETISTEGAGQPGLPVQYICPVQGIVFAFRGTGHALGTAVLIDCQPERIHISAQVYDGADGTISCAMDHTTLFA